MKLVLQEDSNATDARMRFAYDFHDLCGVTLPKFIELSRSEEVNNGMTIQHAYENYILEVSGDDPYYKLYEKEKEKE